MMKRLERATRRALLAIGCFSAALGLADAANAEPGKYFIAIHCDPQHADEDDWDALVALVDAANGHEQKLTIQLNPAWGPIIAEVYKGPDQIAGWATSGHEISGHHHVLGHSGGWDGYSNEGGAAGISGYLGDMQQWLTDLEAILPEGISVKTVASKDHDFPAGVPFQTGGTGSTTNPDSAASIPTPKILAGDIVWNLDNSALIAGGTWQIDETMAAFDAATSDQVFGVAVHPQDYYEGNRVQMTRWLLFLDDRDPTASRSVTAGALLQAHVDSLEGVPAGSPTTLTVQIATLLALGGLALRRSASRLRR